MLNLIMTILAGNVKAKARRGSIIAALIGVAVFLAVVGLAYGFAALRTWLALRYDSITADLALAGAFLLVAAGFALAAKIVSNRPPPPDPTAALTGALAPLALGILAQFLKSQAGPAQSAPAAPAPQPAGAKSAEAPVQPAADAPAGETIQGVANLGGAALAILPALVIGLLLGRKIRS